MKKFVAMMILCLVIICSVASAEIYPQAFVISEVNYEENTILLVDCNGEGWIWEGIEDYGVGDIIAAIMDDSKTETIYDDIIIMIRYAGYMEGWE